METNQIIELLKRDKQRTLEQIAYIIKKDPQKTKQILSELKREGKIENKSSRRGSYWKIRRKND